MLVAPAAEDGQDRCAYARSGETCGPGNGRKTPGGGDKASHEGWPAVTGIFWQVKAGHDARLTGGSLNDDLLGHRGSDRVSGGAGHDILWGDWDPRNNTGTQRDVLRGGAGNDWIYPSHGRTTVLAGKGKDRVWAFYRVYRGAGYVMRCPGCDMVALRIGVFDSELTGVGKRRAHAATARLSAPPRVLAAISYDV